MFNFQPYTYLTNNNPLTESPFLSRVSTAPIPTPVEAKFLVTMNDIQLTTMNGTYLQTMGPNSAGDYSYMTTQSGGVLTTESGDPLITQGPIT